MVMKTVLVIMMIQVKSMKISSHQYKSLIIVCSAAKLAALSWNPENLKKAIVERVFASFCDKNAVFTNFRDKNAVFTSFRDKNCAFELRDKNPVFGFNG